MILKIALLIGLYFVFKTIFKAMRIVNEYETNKTDSNQSKTSHKKNEDIVEAEYTVIKE